MNKYLKIFLTSTGMLGLLLGIATGTTALVVAEMFVAAFILFVVGTGVLLTSIVYLMDTTT